MAISASAPLPAHHNPPTPPATGDDDDDRGGKGGPNGEVYDDPQRQMATPSPSPPALPNGISDPSRAHTTSVSSSLPPLPPAALQSGRMLPPGAGYAVQGIPSGGRGLESVPEAPGSAGTPASGQDSRPLQQQQWEQAEQQGTNSSSPPPTSSAPLPPTSAGSISSRPPLPNIPSRDSTPPASTAYSASPPLDSSLQPQPPSAAYQPRSSSPLLYSHQPLSRPSVPLPTPPSSSSAGPPPLAPPVRRGTDNSTDGDYALPLEFSPIPTPVEARRGSQGDDDLAARGRDQNVSPLYGVPGDRVLSDSRTAGGSGYRTSTTSARSSTIPSFIPAAAFSANDRGPYPPHASPTSIGRPESMPYFSSMDGACPSLSGGAVSAKGKGREGVSGGEQTEVLGGNSTQRASGQYLNDATGASAVATGGDRPSFELPSDLSQSMVGVGRNSIIRNSLSPPLPQHQLLGPAPTSPTGPGSPSSPIASQQYAPPQQQYSGPRPVSTGGQLPPHLIQQPEVCVECMMRDRDMADVDVVGEGIWDRESDAEFEEAMRWDAEDGGATTSGDHRGGGSEESSGGTRSRRKSLERGGAGGSRESAGGRSSTYGVPPRKRLGRGQPLTTASLKLWTSMNPPASAHRWRTLQGYLQTQMHLIELERQAREATAAERDRATAARVADARQSAPAFLGSMGSSRSRASTLLPNGLAAESLQEDRQARPRGKSRGQEDPARISTLSLQPYPTMPAPQPPYAASSASVRSYSHGDQPWLANGNRRFSSPGSKDPNGPPTPSSGSSSIKGFSFGKFARSSTDLRSIGSPRSVSPARTSLGVDERRGSVWSKFRQSASQSVLSFAPSYAPSGSMMDMHVGLSMDKHMSYGAPYETYPSMSDPAVARHVEKERDRALEGERETMSAKPKKKGVKGFFSKLVGGSKKREGSSASAPTTPRVPLDFDDDHELAPPPPLSALANEPRYHGRSPSTSSVDSFGGPPYTPPPLQPPSHFRLSSGQPLSAGDYSSRGGVPADRGSIMTMGSYSSARSGKQQRAPIPIGYPGGALNASQRLSGDSLDASNLALPRTGSPEPYSYDDRAGDTEILESPSATIPPPLIPSSTVDFPTPGPPQPRLQKSLPCLPAEANDQLQPYAGEPSAYPFPERPILPYAHQQGAQSAYSVRSSKAYGTGDDGDDWGDAGLGGGRKSKARSKVLSFYNFGSSNKKKAAAAASLHAAEMEGY